MKELNLITILKNDTYITQDSINYITNITLRIIKEVAAQVRKVNLYLLSMRTRKREIVEARQLYFYFAKKTELYTLESIGNEVNRDHATVMHGISTINDLLETDIRIKNYSEQMEKILKERVKT